MSFEDMLVDGIDGDNEEKTEEDVYANMGERLEDAEEFAGGKEDN